MASSNDPALYYNPARHAFSFLGKKYIRAIFKKNPKPSQDQIDQFVNQLGCSEKQLKKSLLDMRKREKKKSKSAEQPAPVLEMGSSEEEESPVISLPMLFLRKIKQHQAGLMCAVIEKRIKPDYFISPARIGKEIRPEEIHCLTSDTLNDGKFFFDWLKCYSAYADIHDPPARYPSMELRKKTKHFEFIHPELRSFLLENQKDSFGIHMHHIVLRSITSDEDFKVLSQYGPDCASHLCDTRYCLRMEHLTTETVRENQSRIRCPGLIMILREKHIVEYHPCSHGQNNSKAHGDPLKYTCRRITFVQQHEAATNYYRSLF